MAPLRYDTFTARIAPALLLTATQVLFMSIAARLGRIVDGIRAFVDICDQLRKGEASRDFPVLRRKHATDALRRLHRRTDRTMFAVTMLYPS